MQNTGSSYQAAPQGSYPDHNYESPMLNQCQQGSYPMYMNNNPYPSGNPRLPPPHYYGSHQMQQGVHYRGNYAPQNHYGPSPSVMNHDMYRNHHPPYGEGSRNMSSKPVWGENNPADMVPMYNNVPPHAQMNSSPSMNASTLRSPPHLPSNMNHAPSPGSQHYRQMQSPAGSPQTWTQVPSPGIHNAARTTPSPLQAHSHSPGHSQPFSPPSSVHIVPPPSIIPQTVPSGIVDSCHPIQMVNAQKSLPADPLHSLQKMLEQESCEMNNISADSQSIDCNQQALYSGSQDVMNQQGISDESKDSGYATYFNLDENRLESEPQRSTPKPSVFLTITPVEPAGESSDVLNNNSLIDPQPMRPTFVAPDKALNTMYSENVLNVTPARKLSTDIFSSIPPPIVNTTAIPSNGLPERAINSCSAQSPDVASAVFHNDPVGTSSEEQEPTGNSSEVRKCTPVPETKNSPSKLSADHKVDSQCFVALTPIDAQLKVSTNVQNYDFFNYREEKNKQSRRSPSIVKLIAVNSDQENLEQGVTVKIKPKLESIPACSVGGSGQVVTQVCEVPKKCVLSDVQHNFDTNVMSNEECAVNVKTVMKHVRPTKKNNMVMSESVQKFRTGSSKSHIITSDMEQMPVKVVIHRIKSSDMNDTWHVPKINSSPLVEKPNLLNNPVKSEATGKASNIGPQIIILSPAMSRKKFGSNTAGEQSSGRVKNPDNTKKTSPRSLLKVPSQSKASGRRVTRSSTSSESPRCSPRKQLFCGSKRKTTKTAAAKKKLKPSTLRRKRKVKKKLMSQEEDVQLKTVPKQKVIAKPFNGPYVHITGSKMNPSAFTVVNVALREDEKNKISKGNVGVAETIWRPRVGHTSTLSPNYDAFNKDKTWLCAFCQRGSHCCGLGDLYGPYYVQGVRNRSNANSQMTYDTTPCSSRGIRVKRRKSDASVENCRPTSPKKSRLLNNDLNIAHGSRLPIENFESPPHVTDDKTYSEIWIHEDCAIWCQDVSLIGSQVQGLEGALQEALQNPCSLCKLAGATLGCWIKNCKEQYHFCCAKEKGCQLDFEKFSVLCSRHKDARLPGKKRSM